MSSVIEIVVMTLDEKASADIKTLVFFFLLNKTMIKPIRVDKPAIVVKINLIIVFSPFCSI